MPTKPFNPPRCWNCNKLLFNQYDNACLYAEWLEERHNFYIRVYWSNDCGCYHFTSSQG
jgi:hypothetical protein